MRELFIERDGFLRIARTNDGQMDALRVIRDTDRPMAGDICTGIIRNVSRAQQAVFVDIGSRQNAYLRLPGGKNQAGWNVGDVITVEVLRSESGKKGAKVTAEVSLTNGRLAVSEGRGYTFSKNTDSEAFYVRHGAPPIYPGLRLLIRSGSLELSAEEFRRTADELARTFREILERAGQTREPMLLHRDASFIDDLLRDIPPTELLFIHSNDPLLSEVLRSKGHNQITEYPAGFHLFHRHGIEQAVERLRGKVLPLPGGGSLVIEETEALTAIDVNSGARGGKGVKLSAYELNETALVLALEQIRLRSLAGIIIIDFVTMERENDARRLHDKARELTAAMQPLTKAYPLTELGLMQIARRRQGESLSAMLFRRDDHKKSLVSASYLYKLIRIRLDDPAWAMERFEISLNPAYGLEMKALEELLSIDYPHFDIHISLRPEVETVRVLPRLTPAGEGKSGEHVLSDEPGAESRGDQSESDPSDPS